MLSTEEGEVATMLLMIVRSLVDQPDKVEVVRIPQEASTTFRIWVDPTDVGKVIGMNGRTARALRTIVGANASKMKRSLSVDIQERAGTQA